MARQFGRPPKLNEDFIAKAIAYLDGYEDEGELIPSIAGLSVYTRVSREQIHSWNNGEWPQSATESVREDFSDIIRAIASTQEQKLVSGGLSGRMNSTITKLILTKHNYSDKVETDHKSTDGSMSGAKDLNITVVKGKK